MQMRRAVWHASMIPGATPDGILEYYWGKHIHLGYYTKEEMEAGYKKNDFINAKKKKEGLGFLDIFLSKRTSS
jgi:hypothetical protein